MCGIIAHVLQGGDFVAAAYYPVVGSSSATSADRDEILPAGNWGVKDKHRIDVRGALHARPRNLDSALARLLLQPHAFVVTRKVDQNFPADRAQLMAGGNHVKLVGRLVEDV